MLDECLIPGDTGWGGWRGVECRDAKFRPSCQAGPESWARPGFFGARTEGTGLMPGSWEAITMYYVLAAGLRAVLARYWPGSRLCSPHFVRCRSGLGHGFWGSFCISGRVDLVGWREMKWNGGVR